MNVFVFPACNEPGLEAIRALGKSNKIDLFGGSSYNLDFDPARHLLQNYVPCPGINEPGFEEAFKEVLRKHGIAVVFPTMDVLVAMFSRWQMPGVTFVTPRVEIAELLLSKRATYERLDPMVPVPRLYDAETAPLPVFAKPDQGGGSRNSMAVRTREELRVAAQRDLLLCEHLPGDEYTVDCISDRQGRLLFAGVRERGRIGRGISLGTRAVDEPRIAAHVAAIADILRIEGIWFAQFKRNAQGDPVLLEVNARVAGSMTLTRLMGVNIPLMAFFLYTGQDVRVPRPRPGVLLNRSLANHAAMAPFDSVVWDWDDTIIRRDGKPDPKAMACLYDLHNRAVRQFLVTKNPDVETAMEQHQIPRFFVDVRTSANKVDELGRLLADHGLQVHRCVVVNDSYIETFAIQERYPGIRNVTPDALDVLGCEAAC